MTEPGNDPTRSGAPAPAPGPGALSLSRGEVEALCLKAARGAGMSWGIAEEAGFAARWLCEAGLDGPALLLPLLDLWAGEAPPAANPLNADGGWSDTSGHPLCPVSLGAALCDHAATPGGVMRTTLQTGPVVCPVLVLPFLGCVAGASGKGAFAEWNDWRVTVGPTDFRAETGATTLRAAFAARLRIGPCTPLDAAPKPQAPPPCSHGVLRRLDAYAMRTTVPASEASRAGAGSDRSDND